MSRELEEIIEEAKSLMNDHRTGLKDSSDTNKTRYSILGLIEEAWETTKQTDD